MMHGLYTPPPHTLTYEELQAFAPPTRKRKGFKDPGAILDLLPLRQIPTCLKPQPNQRMRPPLFRLGYVVTNRWAAEYARKHGLVEEEEEEDLFDESDENDDLRNFVKRQTVVDEATATCIPQHDHVDVGCRTQKIIDHINAKVGSKTLKVTNEFILPLPCYVGTRTVFWLLSIGTTNVARDGPLPTPEDLIRLHNFLGLDQTAAWFLDFTECVWEERDDC